MIEAYDRHGFYIYLCAEHHATPLGLAPSPGIFLSAVAARTKKLRLGPLVYTLPLYHPLRLIEEICMLDQLSGGRFEFGVGRGISPIEVGYYGVDPEKSQAMFGEALEVVMRGLKGGTLDFAGEFYRFKHVPMVLEPHAEAASAALVRRQHSGERRPRRGQGHERGRQYAGGRTAGDRQGLLARAQAIRRAIDPSSA